MSILLIGLVTLAFAVVVERRRGVGVLGWALAAVFAVLVLGQLWWAGDRLEGYRVEVLAQRFHAASSEGAGWSISGDQESADLLVPGLGDDPASRLLTTDTSVAVEMGAGTGVTLAREPGQTEWTVLGAAPLTDGDQVAFGGDTITFRRIGGAMSWLTGTEDRVHMGPESVLLPYPHTTGVFGAFKRRPNVFQRAYPLADLFGDASEEHGYGRLRSFLFYQDGTLQIAALDQELEVVGQGSAPGVRSMTLWRTDAGSGRLLLAGLPLRDFPEDRLVLPERFGVRPLRSYRFDVSDGWVTAERPRSELHLLKTEDMTLASDVWGDASYRVRVGVGESALGAAGIVLSTPSDQFRTAAEGILHLPDSPLRSTFSVVSPAGLASHEVGAPFTLSDGERGILLRLDGFGFGLGLAVSLIGLILLGGSAFTLIRANPTVVALAGLTWGVVVVRLLLSVSAMVRYPFVDEGHQISLWMLAGMPWVVLGLGSLLAATRTTKEPGTAVIPRGFSGGFMGEAGSESPAAVVESAEDRNPQWEWIAAVGWLLLAVLALVLFPVGRSKAAVLGGLSLALGAVRLFAAQGGGGAVAGALNRALSMGVGALGKVPEALTIRFLRWPGLATGLLLLGGRIVLELLGFREQISLAGIRIGLSVIYTPLSFLAFGAVLLFYERLLQSADSNTLRRRVFVRGVTDLLALLALGFGLAGLWISDLGIVLTTLPGPLLVLAFWGLRHAALGRGAVVYGFLPLVVFGALQASPSMILAGAGVSSSEIPMAGWSRNELLLLERGDPEALNLIGESRSEALAVMRQTMRSYTRGNLVGQGFLEGRVSPEIRPTATREHLVSGLLASQWGLFGVLGLLALLGGFLRVGLVALRPLGGDGTPVTQSPEAHQPEAGFMGADGSQTNGSVAAGASPAGAGKSLLALTLILIVPGVVLSPVPAGVVFGLGLLVVLSLVFGGVSDVDIPGAGWLWPPSQGTTEPGRPLQVPAASGVLGGIFLLGFAAAGLYMVLANYGLVLFTGKNVYLLGLDSLGDALESIGLLGAAVAGLGWVFDGISIRGPATPSVPRLTSGSEDGR